MSEARETDLTVLSVETLWVGTDSVLENWAESDLRDFLVERPSSL